MQFQVPQYIDIEDKVFGNFTLKQFIFIAGGIGFAYFAWVKLPFFIAIPFIALFGGLAGALAFLPKTKFGKPFSDVLEAGFSYLLHKKLYLWRRDPEKITPEMVKKKRDRTLTSMNMPSISDSKLKDMSWGLEVKSDQTSDDIEE